MIARKLKAEEQYLSELNMAVAFEGGFDLEKARAAAEKAEIDPNADHWGAFPEGESRPVASFVMNKYNARFDGHTVKMGGVGGVALLPAYRRGGAVRACIEEALRDIYNDGFLLSALYPFSTAFYRKFGFENGQPCYEWTLPLADLKLRDVGGRAYQLFPGDDTSALLKVYNAFYSDCNLSVIREKYDPALEKENLLEQKRYIFVWEDENGEPGAFLIGSRKGDLLNCRTDFSARNGLLFKNARALQGLLNFVRTAFIANFKAIYFTAPAFVNIMSIIPEATTMGCGMFLNGMLRVVNAEQALKLCKCRGEGSVTVKISDMQVKENNGTYRIQFAPGVDNTVQRTDEQPDISVNIGDFSALLCGVRSAEELDWMPEVVVNNPAAPLGAIFYKKHCHVLDLF